MAAVLVFGCGDSQRLYQQPGPVKSVAPHSRTAFEGQPLPTLEGRNNSGGLGYFLQVSTLPLAIEREWIDAQEPATASQPNAGDAVQATGTTEVPSSDPEPDESEEEEETPVQ